MTMPAVIASQLAAMSPACCTTPTAAGTKRSERFRSSVSATASSGRGRPAADEREGEEQAHAEDRAGEGDAGGVHRHLAGELAEEEQGQRVDHRRAPGGSMRQGPQCGTPVSAQPGLERRAGAALAGAAGGVDDGAGAGEVDLAQQRLDRADRGRAHGEAAEADGGERQRLDRAAGVLAAEGERRAVGGAAGDDLLEEVEEARRRASRSGGAPARSRGRRRRRTASGRCRRWR